MGVIRGTNPPEDASEACAVLEFYLYDNGVNQACRIAFSQPVICRKLQKVENSYSRRLIDVNRLAIATANGSHVNTEITPDMRAVKIKQPEPTVQFGHSGCGVRI